MSKQSDRAIIHDGDELWCLDNIIKNDFPRLRQLGYRYAVFSEGAECECYIMGFTQRWRAIKHAELISDSRVYDIVSNKRIIV